MWFDLQFGSEIIIRSLMGKFLPVQIVTSCLMEVLIRLDGLFCVDFFYELYLKWILWSIMNIQNGY